jgi:hypothetical protein
MKGVLLLLILVSARSAGGHDGPLPPPQSGGGEEEERFRQYVDSYTPTTRRFEVDASQVSDAIEQCRQKFKNCTVISKETRQDQYVHALASEREKRLNECEAKQESHWKNVYERNQNAWFFDIRKYTSQFDEPEIDPTCQKEKFLRKMTTFGLEALHAHHMKDVIEITH